MSQTNNASQQLYDILVSRDFEPEALDATGKPAADPGKSEIISFDYRGATENYGTVVVVFDSENNLDVYFSDNMAGAMEGDDKGDWYDFLYLLRMFAKRNLLTFSLKNLSRLKFNMKTMAAVKESIFESFYGNKKVSYSDQPGRARLIIKHNRTLGEGEARHRYIESLFVENAQGERFRVPSKNLTHGKLLARHVAEGGTPYDAVGLHISEIMDEMKTLSGFIRTARRADYDGDAGHMVEAAVRHYQALKSKAKKMLSHRGYQEAIENFDPATISDVDETVETIRELFVRQTLHPQIETALPILARLTTKTKSLPEADQFEHWADQVFEGTWALPDNPEKNKKLKDLMSQELIVGPDATNAQEQLYDLVGDDMLFDMLGELAQLNPDANIWDDAGIIKRLAELGIEVESSQAPEQSDQLPSENEPDLPGTDSIREHLEQQLARIKSLSFQ